MTMTAGPAANSGTGRAGIGELPVPCVGLILALTINGLAVSNYRDLVAVATTAEEFGFDSAWLCDHFLTLSSRDYVRDAGVTPDVGDADPPSQLQSLPLLECWTTLSALARDTSRLRLGTSVLCNSYRYPAVLAKMAATLDVISEGRLDLGLGAGWFEREFEAYGIPFPPVRERVSALEESLRVIRMMWTEPNPTFSGNYYTLNGAVCDPRPVQQPHPPLWIGGEGDRVHRIAAKIAQGVNVRWWSPHQVKQRTDFLDHACESVGRDPSTLRLSATLLLAPTRTAGQESALREEFTSIPAQGQVIGSPERCVERINEYRESGISHFLFTVPHLANSDYLDVIGHEVLPMLKSA